MQKQNLSKDRKIVLQIIQIKDLYLNNKILPPETDDGVHQEQCRGQLCRTPHVDRVGHGR